MDDLANNEITEIEAFGALISINDLRDMDYADQELTTQQRLALKNFDRFRIAELNSQKNENNFHKKYMHLQVMANLTPFNEFLKETYF